MIAPIDAETRRRVMALFSAQSEREQHQGGRGAAGGNDGRSREAMARMMDASAGAGASAGGGDEGGGGDALLTAIRDAASERQRSIDALLREGGWEYHSTNKHHKWRRRVNGVLQTFVMACTPSDVRDGANSLARLRRYDDGAA